MPQEEKFKIMFSGSKKDIILSTCTALLVPQVADNMLVMAGVPSELPLEEGHVDQGGVEVDELEDEHFEGQVVVELRLGSMHLWEM